MRRLSGVDADMLASETPEWHMQVGGLIVLDPASAEDSLDFAQLRGLVARLVERVPPLRERIVEVPLGLGPPLWVQADVDLEAHVRRIAAPPPGGPRELAAVVGTLLAAKLDRGRPLWEFWYIEGLEHGRLAVLGKVHHAMADGVGGATLLGALLGLEPAAVADEPLRLPQGERVPTLIPLLAHAAGSAVTLPWRFARASGRTLRSIGTARRRPPGTGGPEAAAPFQAPRTSFNHPVTASRCVAFTSASLTDVKRVKNAAGATVNDVVLALCAGALRSYLADRGELPDAPLVAAVPVSGRSGPEVGVDGNIVSGWFTSLATNIDDPLERLMAVRAAAAAAKAVYETGVEDIVMQWADLPVPALWALGIRLYTAAHLSTQLPPIFNLLISNVPGAPFPMYAGRAPVVAMYPFGPVLDTIGINITVLSYRDSLDFGILTCPELVPDPWRLAEAIPLCLGELLEATAPRGGTIVPG